jgi:hypothetical protein
VPLIDWKTVRLFIDDGVTQRWWHVWHGTELELKGELVVFGKLFPLLRRALCESLDQTLCSPQAALTGSLPQVCNIIMLNKVEGNGSGQKLIDEDLGAELRLLSQELQTYTGGCQMELVSRIVLYHFVSLMLVSSLRVNSKSYVLSLT